MDYLRMIRPINLLLLLLMQWVIKFGFFEPLGVQVAMETLEFSLLAIATLSIAAGGNVINDIHDVVIDAINKPKKVVVGKTITEKAAYNVYIILNIVGVGSGFVLANRLGHPGLAAVFIIISALLYSYATYLKSMLLVGNLVISLLVASSLLVCIIFDIYPAIQTELMPLQKTAATLVLWYALWAFYVNLMRELVKDIQDVNGDKKGERNTLPIVLGRLRVRNIVFAMAISAMISLLLYAYTNLYDYTLALGYVVFLICGPLLYFCIRAWSAKKKRDFAAMSITLKILMFTGVVSIYFFAEILTH